MNMIYWIIDNFTKIGAFGLMVAGTAVILMLLCINAPPDRRTRTDDPEHHGSE